MQEVGNHVGLPLSEALGRLVVASMELWRILDDDGALPAALLCFDRAATAYAIAKASEATAAEDPVRTCVATLKLLPPATLRTMLAATFDDAALVIAALDEFDEVPGADVLPPPIRSLRRRRRR
jgi:hypothetical protein